MKCTQCFSLPSSKIGRFLNIILFSSTAPGGRQSPWLTVMITILTKRRSPGTARWSNSSLSRVLSSLLRESWTFVKELPNLTKGTVGKFPLSTRQRYCVKAVRGLTSQCERSDVVLTGRNCLVGTLIPWVLKSFPGIPYCSFWQSDIQPSTRSLNLQWFPCQYLLLLQPFDGCKWEMDLRLLVLNILNFDEIWIHQRVLLVFEWFPLVTRLRTEWVSHPLPWACILFVISRTKFAGFSIGWVH